MSNFPGEHTNNKRRQIQCFLPKSHKVIEHKLEWSLFSSLCCRYVNATYDNRQKQMSRRHRSATTRTQTEEKRQRRCSVCHLEQEEDETWWKVSDRGLRGAGAETDRGSVQLHPAARPPAQGPRAVRGNVARKSSVYFLDEAPAVTLCMFTGWRHPQTHVPAGPLRLPGRRAHNQVGNTSYTRAGAKC